MTSNPPSESGADAVERAKLTELRTVLLTLHKTLLDMERRDYEREHGHVSTGELFRLVLDHQQFAWLHNILQNVLPVVGYQRCAVLAQANGWERH